MTSAYLSRLAWMSLASFFLVHLSVGLLVLRLTPPVIRIAAQMRASSAARFLLAVRTFPSVFAMFVVTALCVPSYLWLEPDGAAEKISGFAVTAASLCVGIWAISIVRGARAVVRSVRYVRRCRTQGRKVTHPATAWVIDQGVALGLAGIFRPRIVIRKDVWTALDVEQFDAAVRHEHAHAASHDNLKKLLILLVPDVLPFARTRFQDLDRAWARFAEWAADDQAAGGDGQRSLGLASALVRVTRLATPSQTPHLVTSLVADAEALAVRVNRLLESRPAAKDAPWSFPLVSAGMAVAALATAVVFRAPLLSGIHELLEALVR